MISLGRLVSGRVLCPVDLPGLANAAAVKVPGCWLPARRAWHGA